jgi:hypothetical protein
LPHPPHREATKHRNLRAVKPLPKISSSVFDLKGYQLYGHYGHVTPMYKNYVDCVMASQEKALSWTGNPMYQTLLSSGVSVDNESMRVIEPTIEGINYNLRIRLKEDAVFKGDRKLLNIALSLLKDSFTTAPSTPVKLWNVEVTVNGASGPGFECCPNKGKALMAHTAEILDYLENYRTYPRPMFRAMIKKEKLPLEKNILDRPRLIVYPPTHFYALQSVVTQEFDEFLKKQGHPWVFYGTSLMAGGMHRLANALYAFKIFFKGDVSKFDSSVRRFMMTLIAELRKSVSPPEAHDQLDFIYDTLSENLVVLPDGSVINWNSQPSGSRTTTSDNCLAHLIILFYMCVKRLTELNRELNLQNLYALAFFAIFSDDHVASTSDPLLSTFEYRKSVYDLFGFDLKKEDDLVTTDLSELTFLGGKFVKHSNKYVYYYDSELLATTFHVGHFNRPPLDTANSILSLILLRCADNKTYEQWSQIYSRYCSLFPHLKNAFPFKGVCPRIQYFLNILTGYENGYEHEVFGEVTFLPPPDWAREAFSRLV